jgi:antirestriction protein ArdC/phage/plasmid primase-like uncharacterized protein
MNELTKSFVETVAERLIEQLKEGIAPWQKPWQPGDAGAAMPTNPVTGNRYKGINALHLMCQDHTDQRWMTYKQAASIGAQVRKGEKGTPIQYWKFSEEQTQTDGNDNPVLDAQGNPVKHTVRLERPSLFMATVFNAEQIDGLPPRQPPREQSWTGIERADAVLRASGADIHHGEHDRAFYRAGTDSIHLPNKEQFDSADRYYAIALHELGHWTGHSSRLGRDLGHPFGSEAYAREELRAEIASMIMGDELGIGHDPGQHAAYVGSWIAAIKEDPLEIFRAAADAEKIQDYVLGLERKQVQDRADAQKVAEFVSENLRQAPAKVVRNTFDADPQLKNILSDGAKMQALDASVNALLQGVNRSYIEETRALIASTLELSDAEINVDVQAPSAAYPAVPDADLDDAQMVADFIAANLKLLPEHVATNVGAAPPTLKALLADEVRMQALDVQIGQLLHKLNQASIDETQAIVALTLGRADARARAERANLSGAASHAQSNPESGEDLEVNMKESHMQGASRRPTGRLTLIDAYSEENEFERAVKLARVREEAVRNDPQSTPEDIAAAREVRKDAEFNATQNDADLLRRIAELERSIKSVTQGTAEPAGQQAQSESPAYLNVAYRDKDDVKALGAKWDRREQAWYVPPGVDAAPFAKYAREGTNQGQGALQSARPGDLTGEGDTALQARIYLAVPYADRAVAKAAGAKWDRTAKSWFAGPGADMATLNRWKADGVAVQQQPAISPREEFADALRSVGCVVGGDHPVMDGQKHRISVNGEKHSENSGSGFYVAHLDGHPAGYVKNNKTGMEMHWKSKGYALDPIQKAMLRAQAASKLQERGAEQARRHEQAADRVARQIAELVPIAKPTPYLQSKGIAPTQGVYTDREGKTTYVPATDADGKHWTTQYIHEDGTKRFAKDSRKTGCFHAVGGLQALAAAPALVIAEGYATANSLARSLGHATVAAFDSGNLPEVAAALHQKFPAKSVVIAGDNDQHLETTQGINPGKKKAQEAAQITNGRVVLPIFAPGEVARDPKGFTDFNDLANRSTLGMDGVDRQVRAVVAAAVEKHQGDAEHLVNEQRQSVGKRQTIKIG